MPDCLGDTGEANVVSSPFSFMTPSVCSCRPATILMRVDLPAPLSPRTQVTSPLRTVMLTPRSAWTLP